MVLKGTALNPQLILETGRRCRFLSAISTIWVTWHPQGHYTALPQLSRFSPQNLCVWLWQETFWLPHSFTSRKGKLKNIKFFNSNRSLKQLIHLQSSVQRDHSKNIVCFWSLTRCHLSFKEGSAVLLPPPSCCTLQMTGPVWSFTLF